MPTIHNEFCIQPLKVKLLAREQKATKFLSRVQCSSRPVSARFAVRGPVPPGVGWVCVEGEAGNSRPISGSGPRFRNYHGCGSTTMGSYFGAGAPPTLVYFSGDWDVHWGYGLLTHGQIRKLRFRNYISPDAETAAGRDSGTISPDPLQLQNSPWKSAE